MILPTMNDDERCYEVYRICQKAYNWYNDFGRDCVDKIRNANRFPYFIHRDITDDHGNKWTLGMSIGSKQQKKKKLMRSYMFTPYVDEKGGRGAIGCDPMMLCFATPENMRGAMILDLTPHALARYTQRYCVPNGKDYDFQRKIDSIMLRWQWFDVLGDKHSLKYDKGLLPYDVYMSGGGMMRGWVINPMFVRFYTYVSDDLLFSNQRETQDKIGKEFNALMRDGTLVGKRKRY